MADITTPLGSLSVHDACVELEIDPALLELSIELPVGFKLSIDTPIFPHPGDIAGRLLAKANAALAPLSPIFDIVDTLLVVKDVFDAVKSLSPPDIGKAIGKLVKKLDKLLKLIPQVSIPATIKSLLSVIVALLQGIKADLQAIADAQAKIDLSAQRATALAGLSVGGAGGGLGGAFDAAADLQAAIDCAQAGLNFQLSIVAQNAQPLNRLIATINLFTSIAGLPEVPGVTLDASGGVAAALAPLDGLIDTIKAARDAVPG